MSGEVSYDREFLHRCCVQFSIPLEESKIQVECDHALRFVRRHSHQYSVEIARALVWRVVDTVDLFDRAGAWRLLNSVILECSDRDSDLHKTNVLNKIYLFLNYLILHRWFTMYYEKPKGSGGEEGGSGSGGTLNPNSMYNIQWDSIGKVVPSEVLNGVPPALSNLKREQIQSLITIYSSILASWKSLWKEDVYYTLKTCVRAVEKKGNRLEKSAEQFLQIPSTFKDSLWRLRRKSPSPAGAWQVLRCFGWYVTAEEDRVEGQGEELRVRPSTLIVPKNVEDVRALDPTMHPVILIWSKKLIDNGGGCRMCNTWRHSENRCPCESPFIRYPVDEEKVSFRRLKLSQSTPRFTKMEALEVLYANGITLPLKVDVALDTIVKLIQREEVYDDVLDAFDVVRGAVTGPLERHALWLHASHSLKPSATIFEKPSDDELSRPMRRAKQYLLERRRYRDWKELYSAVEVLDGPFRRRALPPRTVEYLEEIRETSSFLFCLIDGSLPPSYTPGRYARVPEEVVQVAPLKDILCRSCLEPFHFTHECPHRKGQHYTEEWDLRVAREALEEYHLERLRWPQDQDLLDAALRQIDEDDRKAKDFRKAELTLAAKLIHGRRIPICAECNITGHPTRRCILRARRVLSEENFRELEARLYPERLERRISELFREGARDRAVSLREALEAFTQGEYKRFPPSYGEAITQLTDAGIPLAAARYSNLEVQNFLHSIGLSDLLVHLPPLKEADFPEVCLYCDSLDHRSEDCATAFEEEQGFLKDLRQYGVDLWSYLRRRSHYDDRIPTSYTKGRAMVLEAVDRFRVDYKPDGVAQRKFIERNNLETLLSYTQSGSQLSLYGSGFSRPVQATTANTTELWSAAHEEEVPETMNGGETHPSKRPRSPSPSEGNDSTTRRRLEETEAFPFEL